MFRSGPDRVEYNRFGPSPGHKIYYFRVQSGSGQDITGHYGVGVPKTLPPRTLICVHDLVHAGKATHSCLAGLDAKKSGGTITTYVTARWLPQQIPPLIFRHNSRIPYESYSLRIRIRFKIRVRVRVRD